MPLRAPLARAAVAVLTLLAATAADVQLLARGGCPAGESDAADDLACATVGSPPSSSLGLLQRTSQSIAHGRRQRQASEAVPPAPAGLFQEPAVVNRSLFPFYWLHVPKTGSSFLNALIKAPGACPLVPKSIVISDLTMGFDNLSGFWVRFPDFVFCPGSFATRGNHNGFGSSYDLWKGKAVTILRNPEQRMLSSFKDNRHSWPATSDNPPTWNLTEYANQLQGCMVKMLMRDGISHPVLDPTKLNYGGIGPHWGGPCGSSPEPSASELAEAKKRLRDGFAFVGIQEEWELSMCLFHATYGGPCYGSEFVDTRHQIIPKFDYNDEFWLKGWKDPYDDELYEEAQKLFWERFNAKGLSVETCQVCFAQAGVTYPAPGS